MTVFGWDASHFDGQLSTAILAQARREGVHLFTHKIGEGTSYDDPGDRTALAAARDAGIECVGGYHVVRSVPVQTQVDYLISLANRDEPWWREHPGWFWQVDLERWKYDDVKAPTGVDFARRLRDKTRRQVIVYASHSQYGDQLTGWDGPLWNADYVPKPAGQFAGMYPGDDWTPLHGAGKTGWRGGWAAYSGQTPALLQYTSSATIAGLTTCDANAFRGTLDQLKALIGAGPTIDGGSTVALRDDPDGIWMLNRIYAFAWLAKVLDGPEKDRELAVVAAIKEIRANVAGLSALTAAVQAVLDLVKAGGADIDTAAVMAKLAEMSAAESEAVIASAAREQALAAQIAALQADLDRTQAALAQAAG